MELNRAYAPALDLLRRGLAEMKIPFTEGDIGCFNTYLHGLMTLPYNLTAIKTPEDSVTHHFLDSLAALPLMGTGLSGKILDVGSGAGFPLLPVKILRKEIDCTFLDSRTKSTLFIDSMVQQLGLDCCRTIHEHTSQLRRQKPDPFDVIVSRAFGDVTTILEEGLSLLKPQGLFYLYKGPQVDAEIKAVPAKLLKSVEIVSCQGIHVPFLEKQRILLVIRKL